MSLRWKFLLRNWGLVVGLLLVGVASMWGLDGLRRQFNTTLGAYDDMRTIQAAEQKIYYHARPALEGAEPDRDKAAADIRVAAEAVRQFIVRERPNYNVSHAEAAAASLADALAATDSRKAIEALDAARGEIEYSVTFCRSFIERNDEKAGERLWYTMLAIGGIFVLTLAAATISGVLQYRTVMLPLERLREGVRRVAAAQFSGAVEETGDKEFVELSAEFNRMARELGEFYRRLEEKVVAKSRELVKSERLASVGFLAAGVAHEINNPLNIISGYAELSLRRLASSTDESAVEDTRQVLRVIRDESFRCKDITGKLLSLAKGGGDSRETLSLDSVAREVAVLARGLKDYRDRELELKFDGPLNVLANATEMKQVLLNLTVNALQAVSPGDGRVLIEGRRKNGWVELCVADNGYGMSPDSLKHVFEPFFTRKPGARAPGTGLGLSITHAIVENHGGRIRAESEGVGQGSRFTVELPAVAKEGK